MLLKNLVILGAALLLVGCGVHSAASSFQPLEPGERLAIVPFRDCTIPDQEDCSGSGNIASSVFAATLNESSRLKVVPISRPAPPAEIVADEEACATAAARNFAYVINGEVNDFYRVAPMTFRKDRASVTARVLAVADCSIVATAIESSESITNAATPEGMIKRTARKLRTSLGG